MPRRTQLWGVLAVVSALVGACADATDVEVLEIGGSGVLFGSAFLDFDGDGLLGGGDQPLVGVGVVLVTSTSAEVVQLATTDSTGGFTLFEVPVGAYRLSVDSAAVGDSLEVLGGDDPIAVALGDTTLVNLGVTYPTRTIEQLQSEPVGRRVFTSGIALNSRQNFDPTGQVHFAGSTAFLRALNMERSLVATGDSVRVLGRVVSDNGRPALDLVTPNVLVSSAALPIPRETTALGAATADGGALDAALVRIRNVEITDTSTNVEGHFRFWAVDGADSVEIVMRSFLGLNTAVIRPDTTIRIGQATGLLTPLDDGSGTVRWRILPRAGTDVGLETKFADVGVTAALDTTAASLGDVVEFTVVASSGGPLTAGGVEILTTTPSALTFVSATSTSGSYDSGSGVWSLGDMVPAASDTLRVQLEVTDGTATSVGVAAQSQGLLFEVDGNTGNDGSVVILTIS